MFRRVSRDGRRAERPAVGQARRPAGPGSGTRRYQRRRFRINRIKAAGLSECRRRGQLSSPALLFNPARHRVRAICVAGFWDGQGQFVRRQPGDAILVSGH